MEQYWRTDITRRLKIINDVSLYKIYDKLFENEDIRWKQKFGLVWKKKRSHPYNRLNLHLLSSLCRTLQVIDNDKVF